MTISCSAWKILIPSPLRSQQEFCERDGGGGAGIKEEVALWAGPIFLKLILLGEILPQDRNLLNYINIIVTRKIQ